VDIAEETSEMAKQNILMQAGTAMLAQANSVPKMALSLLQNG
jgi:flagellin